MRGHQKGTKKGQKEALRPIFLSTEGYFINPHKIFQERKPRKINPLTRGQGDKEGTRPLPTSIVKQEAQK